LGNISLSNIAYREALKTSLMVRLKNSYLVYVQGNDGTVADHIHVCPNRFFQKSSLGCTKYSATGLDPCVSSSDLISDAAAVEQRIAHINSAIEITLTRAPARANNVLVQS
jgi:hypothetical protein